MTTRQTLHLTKGDTFVLQVHGLEFSFEMLCGRTIRAVEGSPNAAFDSCEDGVATGEMEFSDETDTELWRVFSLMMNGTATAEDRIEWQRRLTIERMHDRITSDGFRNLTSLQLPEQDR